MNARRGRLTIAVLAACAAVAAPAQAAPPEQTLTGISGSYDAPAGAVRATATLAAAPSPAIDATLAVTFGRQSGGGCSDDLLLVTTTGATDPAGSWILYDGDGTARPTPPREASGATITIGVADPALAGRSYDCVWARTLDKTDVDAEYSRTGPVPLGAAAPTPPPAPPPAPAPTPVQPPKAAKLRISVKGVQPVKRNRWLPVRVTVANVGGKTARGVKLKVKPGSGAAASKRKAKVGTIKPGKSRKITLRLRTKRAASVSLVASAGRLKASKRVPLVLRGKVKPPSEEGLGGRWFTSFEVLASGPTDTNGVLFVDGRWAYRGIPEGGIPACTRKTGGVDEDGDPTDGCVPYTYDAKSGAVTIDGTPASLSSDGQKLAFDEDDLWLTPYVEKGAKLTVSLKSIFTYGYWPNQSVTTTWLELTSAGEFMLSGQTLGSWGAPGTPGSGNFSTVPPDQHGTYAVVADGKLRLTYADGRVVDKTIGIYSNPETGSADPAKDGLWLDDEPYWLDDVE
jgi:hypothetical protein